MSLVDIINQERYKGKSRYDGKASLEIQKIVMDIIHRVIQENDQSLYDMTHEFDQVDLSRLNVPKQELLRAEERMEPETKRILTDAIKNIREFHEHQVQQSWANTTKDGTRLGEIVTPLDRVGIYVPGGRAFYPSSLIMNAVPALLAGVPSIAVVSPPGKDGLPHPLVLGLC